MATTENQNSTSSNRRAQVMVGELPEDFLRVPTSAQQQQVIADERVAQILQAQQAAGVIGGVPTNIAGRLTISIVQAKLTKNYGLTKMDPYCRIRLGHSVFETPTAYNGAKNPRWGKDVNIYLPTGVDCMYLEIFDERAFAMDDRIAWSYITIPQAVLNGETPVESLPQSRLMYSQPLYMQTVPTMYYPQMTTVGGVPIYPAQQPVPQPQQQQQPQRPMYTEEDLQQVKELFPNMEDEVIKSVLEANRGNKDATINSLLQMNSD
ncbi:hypothetical protein KUTeg_008018 [Tegillarca granosa]|uniref:Toll-interacting protein n=1 Tax=Tegillarca granosa TaxID=220873 RepID=A0ABQ9FJH8_TEGGR|nr:hypothetical protein KUTeg_008018 [Tegillarca granosa]